MSDPIATFFDAWQITGDEERLEKITSAVAETIEYTDPGSTDTITGIKTLSDYVSQFSTNAPGWSAKVVRSDTTAKMVRATVAFTGKGPDGKERYQLGQYFVELEGELIARMVGFVGTGQPQK